MTADNIDFTFKILFMLFLAFSHSYSYYKWTKMEEIDCIIEKFEKISERDKWKDTYYNYKLFLKNLNPNHNVQQFELKVNSFSKPRIGSHQKIYVENNNYSKPLEPIFLNKYYFIRAMFIYAIVIIYIILTRYYKWDILGSDLKVGD